MPETNNLDPGLELLIWIVAVFLIILLIIGFAIFVNNFSLELQYLNKEIRRTEGADRRRFIRQRRRLWLSLIPFVKY